MTDAPSPDPTPRPARRALAAIASEAWAILPEALETILAVAERETELSPQALEAYRGKHVPTAERLTRRGPVAIIEAVGPMFRRANIFTALSGATSYDVMRRDLQAALDDDKIRAIVLNLDTPGGSVNGADELAKAIYTGKSVKPIVAYIGGTGASAGYWLASQATEIVVSDAAIVGSIGVVATMQDTSEADRKAGKVEFISSQSPGKRAALDTDEGRARVQRTVDSLADVFIAAVARGRGVSAKTVIERFGAGDVLVGAAVVKAGMADRLGSFEAVVSALASGKEPTPQTSRRKSMELSADALSERERIRSILTADAAKGREATAQHLAFGTLMTAQEAVTLLGTLPSAAPAPAPSYGPRAKDAPGGLVTVDPVLTARPDQAGLPTAGSKDANMWSRIVGELNKGAPANAIKGEQAA